jgi:putative DNA primase/helicase
MLPGVLRPWLIDIAERTQAPLDFGAVGAIVCLSAVIGRALVIRPKMHDDWEVAPNLWGAAVGRTGVMKSPALKAAMTPLQRLVADAMAEHKRAIETTTADSAIRNARIKHLKHELEASVAGRPPRTRGPAKVLRLVPADDDPPPSVEMPPPPPADPASIAAELAKLQAESSAPVERRYVTNDPSVEKLGELLNENPRGLLLFRDELTGWLRTLDRDGHEGDRAFYLEAWEGRGAPYVYDRIGRGTIRIEAPCVSILGGIQPGPLADYIQAAVRGGVGDDGLIQRLQLAVFPDVSRDWRNVDRWPDTDAKNGVYTMFLRAAAPGLAAAVGACGDPNEPASLPYLRLSRPAQDQFDHWRAVLEPRLRSGDEHPAVEGHLSKYRKLVPALALIFYVVELAVSADAGAVSESAMALAIRWAGYLEQHARRIYATVTRSRFIAAALLGAKLRTGKVASQDGTFSVRDIYRACWTGLDDPDVVTEAADELVSLGWLRAEAVPPDPARGGRRTVRYRPNPKVRPDG